MGFGHACGRPIGDRLRGPLKDPIESTKLGGINAHGNPLWDQCKDPIEGNGAWRDQRRPWAENSELSSPNSELSSPTSQSQHAIWAPNKHVLAHALPSQSSPTEVASDPAADSIQGRRQHHDGRRVHGQGLRRDEIQRALLENGDNQTCPEIAHATRTQSARKQQ